MTVPHPSPERDGTDGFDDDEGPDALGREVEQARRAMEAHDFARAAHLTREVVDAFSGDRGHHDVALEVRSLTILACAVQEVGGSESWSTLLDRAATIVRTAGRQDLRVAVQGATGYCHLREGDPDAALEAFERAEPWLDHCPVEDRARLLLNRGTTHLDIGSLSAADADLDRAEHEALEAGLVELALKARHNRGYVAFLRGDLPTSLDQLASPAVDPDADQAVRAILADPLARMDRARVLLEAGLVDDADDLLAGALVGLRDTQRPQDEGEAHLARARGALVAGELGAALDHTALASARFAERGNDRWLRRTEFTRLAVLVEQLEGQMWMTGGSDASGSDLLASAAADAVELAPQVAALVAEAAAAFDTPIEVPARAMLAEASLLAGDRGAAAAALAHGDPAHDDPVSVRLRWFRVRAGLALASGAQDLQGIVQEGLSELSRAQQRVGSIDLRTAMAIHGSELAELGVADALATGDADVVHRAVERAHASSTRLTAVRSRASDHEQGLLSELRRIDDAQWHADPQADPDRVAELQRRAAHLRTSLRTLEWRRRGAGGRARTVGVEEVRRRIELFGARAVSYVAVGPDLRAVRLDGSSLEVVRLGSTRVVAAEVDRLRADLQAAVLPAVPTSVAAVMQRSIVQTLRRLDELLLRPLEMDPAALVVVPHGPLALVPWPLLPSRRGLATTSVPCLTEWVRLTEDAGAGPEAGRLVALAGPGLARAEAEVAAIGGIWPDTRTLVGPAATGAAVHEALATADVVHLAAHGTHRATSPLFSSLQLADGPVFAHEFDTELRARLVVLSACEVGSHTVRRGDEPLGMTAALLQADVGTVLASLARVRDDVAHDVMLDVHRSMAGGVAPAGALGAAVAAALDDGQVAPFTCVGAGFVPLV